MLKPSKARVTLKNLHTGRELATVTNELGKYFFVGVLTGDYEVSVALAGFAVVTQRVTLTSANPTLVDFQLVPQSRSDSVTVNANPTGIDTSSSFGGSPVLTTSMLKSLARLNDDFQEALPLLPIQARAFASNQILEKLDECFRLIGEKPGKSPGQLQETFLEDFRKEVAEIQSPSASSYWQN